MGELRNLLDEVIENMQVNGQIDGLKKGTLESLNNLYDNRFPKDQVMPEEIISIMADVTSSANREVAVLIDRKGNVLDVSVGDSNTSGVNLPEIRKKAGGLSGIRCIHTHPNGKSTLSEMDISTLKLLRLDMMIAVGVLNGKVIEASAAILEEDMQNTKTYGPFAPFDDSLDTIAETVREMDVPKKELNIVRETEEERAILIGIEVPDTPVISGTSEAEISLLELAELAKTAGAMVVDTILQKRPSKDSTYLIGKGKLTEVSRIVQAKEIDLIIVDDELSGSQLRNIEEFTNTKVVDRTGLILDIFGQRAKSREGRVQVELAQLNYVMPRLQGLGTVLSRLGGGIGTRGPGETKLETDRRHIRRRIDFLKKQLDEIQNQRQTVRREREKNKVPVVALVGYTNAGKSTLLNALCSADTFVEDKLFATLDTTTRRLELGDNIAVLLSDTVGFIRKLPHHLVQAFKSTLEEAVLADLLLIVVDATDPFSIDHIRVVNEILSDLGASGNSSILIWNKWDMVDDDFHTPYLRDEYTQINVSALTGQGFEELKEIMRNKLKPSTAKVRLRIPFSEGWVLPFLYENGVVNQVDYEDDVSVVDAEVDRKCIGQIQKFVDDAYLAK
ncbi:MAG TPA: GTPase HflX [Thermoclostridium sp.]|nr:GTPase HflX [Thermoclostridium sp.]